MRELIVGICSKSGEMDAKEVEASCPGCIGDMSSFNKRC
jgi:hypothetical protein